LDYPASASIKTPLETAGFCWISIKTTHPSIFYGRSEHSGRVVGSTDLEQSELLPDRQWVESQGIADPTEP
jgi:hypothetical protein